MDRVLDDARTLKRVKLTAPPLTMLDSVVRGATWVSDDTIVASTNNGATGLLRVSTTGGPTTVLTRPDRSQGEADHRWPEALPGGQAVLFTITSLTGGIDAAQVAVLDLQTGTRTVLFRGGNHARYVPSRSRSSSQRGNGHLVYASGDALWAVPFDLARLERRGAAVPVVSEVLTTDFGAADAAVAGDGTLAYVAGGQLAAGQGPNTLVWVDRQGRETAIPAPPRGYVHPRVSPDARGSPRSLPISSSTSGSGAWRPIARRSAAARSTPMAIRHRCGRLTAGGSSSLRNRPVFGICSGKLRTVAELSD